MDAPIAKNEQAAVAHPEVFGKTDFHGLFQEMKVNSDKEITVRQSRKDPEGSHAAQFWIDEQIFSQATDEKFPTNSIDLHVIRVKEALEKT